MKRFRLLFLSMADVILAVMTICFISMMFVGCINPNTGSQTIVGEQMALPEITDSSDSIAVRVYESIKGAKVWTAKDSNVHIIYSNNYDNSYFGIVTTKDTMNLDVTMKPITDKDYDHE